MKKSFLYPVYSAILLLLSFRLFGFWLLSFVALVPYFIVLNTQTVQKKAFLQSFYFGALFSGLVLTTVLFHFPLLICIGACICAVMFGLLGYVYTFLKRNTVYDIFLFAILWVLCEWIRQLIFQDFDYTALSYTAYGLPVLLSFASIGGRYLVSFVIVFINGSIGYIRLHGFHRHTKKVLGISFVSILCLYYVNHLYLQSGDQTGRMVSFANIQVNENFNLYGTTSLGILKINPVVAELIQTSVGQKTDYIIFPNNLVARAVVPQKNTFPPAYVSTTFEAVDAALQNMIPASTTFIFWTDTMRPETGDRVYDETDFWQNGSLADYYQKRNPHPFYDLTSQYFVSHGILNKPYEYVASDDRTKIVHIGSDRISNLSCSELNYSDLARADARAGANIIFSVGYASVFEYPVLGELDIPLAQLRAAETHLPTIRSDVRGPSVFIDKRGVIVAEMNANQSGVLVTKLFVENAPIKTLYVLWGDYPLMSILILFLLSIFYTRRIKTNH